MSAEIKWVPHQGEEFRLWPPRGGVFITADSVNGLVASFTDGGVATAGVPGQVFNLSDRVVAPMTGGFSVCVEDVDVWGEFRRSMSTRMVGHLWVGDFRLPCRLAAPHVAPAVRPHRGAVFEVTVVGDGGVWLSHYENTNIVTVTNWGDVPVWPEIVWEGAGGEVKLPSGAVITLPAVDGEHYLSLDRRNAGLIRDSAGVVNRELSALVDVVGESVPVGEEKQFSLPEGALMSWDIGVFDAWSEVEWNSNSGVPTLKKL